MILLHLLVAALYLGLSIHFWRTRWATALQKSAVATRTGLAAQAKSPACGRNPSIALSALSRSERAALLLALTGHGFLLNQGLFAQGQMHFGFALSLSLMLWLAIALYWLESFFRARLEGLQMLGFPLAAACVLLPLFLPSPPLTTNTDSLAFRLHFIVAMLAYSLFTLAALHALLMTVAERSLHRGRLWPLLDGLPPLLTMEALLFRLIYLAFFLLTLTVLSGMLFSEVLFGKPWSFTHETFFGLVSWLIFAALLLGRRLWGWRGKRALRWTLAGFAVLLLAYVGSRFVLEVILHRVMQA